MPLIDAASGRPLLARGREADVVDLGDGRVLRRFRDPSRRAEREAAVMRYAGSQGVPVPQVYDASGPCLVLERLDGTTMSAALARRPWSLTVRARQLAELHRQIHSVAAPSWLDTRVGDGDALLHLDLHPRNVVLSSRGPVVIDWTNAASGAPDIDVADAWLMISTADLSRSRTLSGALRGSQRRFANAFLTAAGTVAREALATAARRRLGDRNVSPSEEARIRALAQL